jgi:hypothetical protein
MLIFFLTVQFSLETLQRLLLLREQPCSDSFAVFLDADVIVASPLRKIESILSIAQIKFHPDPSSSTRRCEVIAQLSPTTLNTGILFFRVSFRSLAIVNDWIQLTTDSLLNNLEWQHEQGWFGYLYSLYLERIVREEIIRDSSFSFPIACGKSLLKNEANRRSFLLKQRNLNATVIYIRTQCLIHSLKSINGFPDPSSYFDGLEICPLNGIHGLDEQFNVHDWNGKEEMIAITDKSNNDRNKEEDGNTENWKRYSMRITSTTGNNNKDNDQENKNRNTPACDSLFPLFYHGKDSLLLKQVKESFVSQMKLLETKKVSFQEMISIEEENYFRRFGGNESCGREKIIRRLLKDSNRTDWILTPEWQTRINNFQQKYSKYFEQ